MNKIVFLTVLAISFLACKKGDSYCEQPFEIISFDDLQDTYNPSSSIFVSVLAELNFSKDQEKTLFSFSVPDIFINPKGENYTSDVVTEPKYTYTLKDTSNYPDSIQIEVYTFNDCGRSDVLTGFIKFQ